MTSDVAAPVASALAAVRCELVDDGRPVDDLSVGRVVERLYPLLPPGEASTVVREVVAAVRGMGPLEPLLADPQVSDVLVNGPDQVWVERAGRLEPTGVVFASDEDILRVVERAVAPLGLRIDMSSPYVDARLTDGSRLHAVLPPVAVDGPCLAIRRFAAKEVSLFDFAGARAAHLLALAVRRRRTIVVSGGTGAGKTTMLNALAAHVADGERLITIEDTAELRLPGRHVVRLEARPPNADGAGEVSIRDLVRNALRMRPDRIVVGECRGAEAFDMLQAINTGHLGSMTTVHANSALDALSRLEAMVLMAGVGLSSEHVRAQLCRAIDLVVHLERGSDGRRSVASVLAVDRRVVERLG
ncbi:MAG TPA: CpaF family protein [Acidimicrobiales bacterium]|nr:CpaF family protein [Acidimicrobiales bacterium]